MTNGSSESSEHRPVVTLSVAVGLAVVVGGLYWGIFAGGVLPSNQGDPLAFDQLRVDTEKLESQRDEQYGDARESLPTKETQKLVSLMEELNELQFPPGDDTSEQKDLAEKLSVRANAVIPHTGYEGFIAAGESLFSRCNKGLEDLLSDVRAGEISIKTAKRNPPDEDYSDYRKACGPFLRTLVKRKLVTPSGKWGEPNELHQTVADILQHLRWGSIIDTGRQAIQHLTDYEVRILMRWRIESEAYPPTKRREYIDLLERNSGLLPDYDPTLARARLAYERGRLERARSVLEKAADGASKGEAPYRRELNWLEEKMRENEQNPS